MCVIEATLEVDVKHSYSCSVVNSLAGKAFCLPSTACLLGRILLIVLGHELFHPLSHIRQQPSGFVNLVTSVAKPTK